MNTDEKTLETSEMKTRLSTLWIFVMFNMAFADIVGFMSPGTLQDIISGSVGFKVTQELLLVFALLLEIPIAMIVLARVLPHRTNRWANIIAALITTVFVIGMGNPSLSYIFFATLEVVAMLLIIWFAWTWPISEVQRKSALRNAEYRPG